MKFRSRLITLLTLLMIFQSMLYGGAVWAGGSNVPNVVEYGLYNYEHANNSTAPSPIGSILTTGNSGSSYTPWPWTTLTDVPYAFSENVGIGIKFAVNVATPTYWDQNSVAMSIYSPSNTIIDADVFRLGDGTNTDVNRDYIFISPKESLEPASTYKIIINAAIRGNNGNQAGKVQEVEFTTTGPAADTTAPTWAAGSTLSASNIGSASLTLTWSSTAQDNVGVTGYKILKNGLSVGTVSGGGTLNYEVSNLSPGTLYNFQVLARDAAGNWSTGGPSVNATTSAANNSEGDDAIPPTWPEGSTLNGTKTGQVVSLNWTAATDNLAVTKYKILVDSSEIDQVDGSTLAYSTSSVSGPHTYKIEAGDAAGNWSNNGPSLLLSGGGDNPLNYVSSNLTTISGSTSSDGDDVDGSSSVPVSPTIRIVFDRNVTNDTIWTANQQCFTMKDSSGAGVELNVSKISNTLNFDERQHVFISPVGSLTAGKTYTITISRNLQANNGNTLGSDRTITFTTTGDANPEITTSAPTITTGSAAVDPALGATVGQGNYAQVVIPANALKGSSLVTVKVQKVASPPSDPADTRAVSDVYEFTIGDSGTYSFADNVTITLSFDANTIAAGEVPVLFYYDEIQRKWISIGGTVSGSTITVLVNHFTKFGVFAVKKAAEETPTTALPAIALNDITGHWAEVNINKLVAMGAVSGYSDGSFKPDENISRAEFVTILVKAFKLEPKNGKVFDDTANSWAKDYIATAVANGIASGYNQQIFGTDDSITREQMVAMVVKAAKLPPVSAEMTYADSGSISDWARESMAAAIQKGFINGFSDNTVRPLNNGSRAEAVTIIINALK